MKGIKAHAIISAHTGTLIGEFSDMHSYIELLLERPVFTHELASKEMWKEIRKKSLKDFIKAVDTIKNIEIK